MTGQATPGTVTITLDGERAIADLDRGLKELEARLRQD